MATDSINPVENIEFWKEASTKIYNLFNRATREKGFLFRIERGDVYKRFEPYTLRGSSLESISLSIAFGDEDDGGYDEKLRIIWFNGTRFVDYKDNFSLINELFDVYLDDEVHLEWEFSLSSFPPDFERSQYKALCLPLVLETLKNGDEIPNQWKWCQISGGNASFSFNPSEPEKGTSSPAHPLFRPYVVDRGPKAPEISTAVTRASAKVLEFEGPRHPSHHMIHQDSAMMNQVMLQYLASLTPEGRCIASVTLTYPLQKNIFSDKGLTSEQTVKALREQSSNPKCRMVGFLVFGIRHVFAACFCKDDRSLEILNTVRTRSDESLALRSVVGEAFGVETYDIKMKHLFQRPSFRLQQGEESLVKGLEDVYAQSGGKGQCAFWALRMLYRRVVMGCSLEEMRTYFETASETARIYSLKSFATNLQNQAQAFAIGKPSLKRLIEDIPLDVPCHVVSEKRKRSRTSM